MIQEKLAGVGVAQAPVVAAVSYLATVTDVLQAILIVVSILATAASGLYYISKWKRERDSDQG